ncbi:MAG: MBOAT family protein [Bacteroidota bacterium]|nr:MBOAT family protein [Bacteroidota bacterium]
MLFNSFEFLIFLPIAFLLYWFLFNKNITTRNIYLLLLSYTFYGWWDWRFLFLIFFSSLIDFIIGNHISGSSSSNRRKYLLWLSLFMNLGTLGVLKYFNFFSRSFSESMESIGVVLDPFTLNVVLPVGISFYTFQTLSYTIDIYRKNLEPAKNAVSFFTYVSFFPQLVAGPIERAVNLLPQFYTKKTFHYEQALNGLRLILWGLFKKMVLADNAAVYVNYVFGNYSEASGLELILGAVMFAFQIYGDFSGYSDIAIGVGKLFGFDLMINFKTPYFSRDIAEFWRRWHISLSTWFRDYLYIPLGGSSTVKSKVIRNVFIIFIVSGFWHGANWTFIIWGVLNAVFFLPLLLGSKNRKNIDVVASGKMLPTLTEAFNIFLTFGLTCFAWIFFRAESVSHALGYISGIFTHSFLSINSSFKHYYIIIILFWLAVEWNTRVNGFSDMLSQINSKIIRRSIYLMIIFFIGLFGVFNKTEFIYFQF